MAGSPFLIERTVPDSDFCILIGPAPEGMKLPAAPFRALLWIADADAHGSAIPTVPGIPASAIERLPVNRPPAEMEAAIEAFLAKSPRHLPSLYVSSQIGPAHELDYLRAAEIASASIESNSRARLTRQQDSFAWQSHLFENLPAYASRRLPESWRGALTGCPAIICGAGPSLEVSIQSLARSAGGAVVFAADSSLRALEKAGVTADFAVSIDVAKAPEKCLPKKAQPGRVVLSINSPPAWLQAIPADDVFFVSSNQLTLDWLAASGIARTQAAVCENCGATAIDVAMFMGCSPIYLFGMDLALGGPANQAPAQRHHSQVDASIYRNSNFNAEQQFPRVPGNFSTHVFTHVVGDWRALDRRLSSKSPGLVFAVTDRGAKLSNTTAIRPEDFAALPALTNKETLLAGLSSPQSAPQAALHTIAEKIHAFGSGLANWVPGLPKVLSQNGPDALAASLRSLFANPEHGQILGAYSLKLMPHLLPPLDPRTDWPRILLELETLANAATRSATALRSSG
jgi:hypothetical protein